MRFSKENLDFGRDQRQPYPFIRERGRKGRGRRREISEKMRKPRKKPRWIRTKF